MFVRVCVCLCVCVSSVLPLRQRVETLPDPAEEEPLSDYHSAQLHAVVLVHSKHTHTVQGSKVKCVKQVTSYITLKHSDMTVCSMHEHQHQW